MRRTNIRWGAAVFVAVAMLAAQQAKATLSFTLNQADVALTGPFGKVAVTLNPLDHTQASVTLTALDSYSFGDGTTLGLNLASTAVSDLIVQSSFLATGIPGGNPPTIKDVVIGNQQVDGWGQFNFAIDLNGGKNDSATALSFTLQRTSGSWATENDILQLNNKGFSVVGHVMNSDGSITGYAVVPEPATILSGFALLLLPFGASALRIIRKNREA